MTQQSNLPGKHNPLKAAYYDHKPSDPAIEARRNAFWERTKITSPKLYEQYVRETKATEAERPFFEVSLDDPEMIALFEHYSQKMQDDRLQMFSTEMEMLWVEAGATKRDIRNAYRRKAHKLHPDVGGSNETFKQLHNAYRRLLAAAKACQHDV